MSGFAVSSRLTLEVERTIAETVLIFTDTKTQKSVTIGHTEFLLFIDAANNEQQEGTHRRGTEEEQAEPQAVAKARLWWKSAGGSGREAFFTKEWQKVYDYAEWYFEERVGSDSSLRGALIISKDAFQKRVEEVFEEKWGNTDLQQRSEEASRS